jgi:hypothetical protein
VPLARLWDTVKRGKEHNPLVNALFLEQPHVAVEIAKVE